MLEEQLHVSGVKFQTACSHCHKQPHQNLQTKMSDVNPILERFRNANSNPDYQKGLNMPLRKALRFYASGERLDFAVSGLDESPDHIC